MISRRLFIAGLALVALLAGCDGTDQRVTFEPLPDASVNWRPYADQALEEQRCSAFLGILNTARRAGDRDTIQYRGALERREICNSNEDERALGDLLIPMLIERLRYDARTRAARVEINRTSVPYYRRTSYQSHSPSALLLSDGLVQAERAWISRCEGPLQLFYGSMYGVRLILVQKFGEQSVLIPEWEARRAECRLLLIDLIVLYRGAGQEQALQENRDYLLTIASAYESLLDSDILLL